jgi:hypothetical protein
MRVALLSVFICVAAAQDRPTTPCAFDGFSAPAKLAEVKRPAGGVMVVYHTGGDWTCGYLQQRDGAGPAWLKSGDLREVPADPAPTLDAWTGTWINGSGRIRIAAHDGKLHLAGKAEWHGAAGVVHTGDFEGDAAPAGNRLHFAGSGADSCTVDLTLIGKYLVVDDNDRCGGMNVRFWGVWKRGGK